MNEIIALRGRYDSGKTTTIRFLYGIVLQNGFELLNGDFNNDGGDFYAVLIKNNIRIGITSSGDTYDLVRSQLAKLMDANCSICVCACRTYDRLQPGTNAAILEYSDYKAEFIEKAIDENESSQQMTNIRQAEVLFGLIENAILR